MYPLVFLFALAAAPQAPIFLWPAGAPGDPASVKEEADTSKPTDRQVAGRPVMRLGNVSRPSMTVYKPAGSKTGAAVLVFPGGGYSILAADLEGTEVCEWLNSIGITGILVKYRVPTLPGRERGAAPLQDAQRAMGLARQHAAEWGIDPKRIGVLGFSAGGHLAAALSNTYQERTYPKLDAADEQSARPDFAVVIYPGYLATQEGALRDAPELKVTKATPPTFLVQTEDDGVRVDNSLAYYRALMQAKVPVEMHLYASGGHGYGLRRTAEPVTTWPLRAQEWFRTIGVLKGTAE